MVFMGLPLCVDTKRVFMIFKKNSPFFLLKNKFMSMNIWDIYNKSGSNKTKKNVQALNFKEFDACLNDLVLAALKEFLDLPSSCLSFCSSTSVRCSKAAFLSIY